MPSVQLIPATVNDIPCIAELAKIIWNQHYPAIIGQEQVNYMLRLMYSAQSLREQMEVKKHCFYLVLFQSKKIGFISVGIEKRHKLFLNKFYIHQQKASKGIGTKAFKELVLLQQPKKISLTVNRQNFKSINFYFKLGFKIEKVADFDIGNSYVMNDFLMVWENKKP